MTSPRLFVDEALGGDGSLILDERRSHYVLHVLRRQDGDVVRLFNGRDGEWQATIVARERKSCRLALGPQVRTQAAVRPMVLAIPPLKRAALELVIKKATELGVSEIRLVLTDYTDVREANVARLTAIATEAAEQCGRLDVPVISPPDALDVLTVSGGPWLFCDESGEAPPVARVLATLPKGGVTNVLVGPAGGFSVAERGRLRGNRSVVAVSLGETLLRAETAAMAALSVLRAWRDAEIETSSEKIHP